MIRAYRFLRMTIVEHLAKHRWWSILISQLLLCVRHSFELKVLCRRRRRGEGLNNCGSVSFESDLLQELFDSRLLRIF